MRWLFPLVFALAACGDSEPPAPKDPNAPQAYRVLRGDNWQSISSKRDCDPDDLRAWNDLPDNHVLIPGQILWIYPNGKPGVEDVPDWLKSERDRLAGGDGTVSATPAPAAVAAAPSAPPSDGAAPAPRPSPEAVAATPSALPRDKTALAVEAALPTRGVGGTALLSLIDIDDAELRHTPSVRADTQIGGGGLAGRGSMGGAGEADTRSVEIGTVSKPPPPGMRGPTSIPKLAKAERKNCLAVDLDAAVLGDQDMVLPEGLSTAQVKAGMRPVIRAVQGCFHPEAPAGEWEVHVEVHVGCDGLVYHTDVVKDSGLPDAVTDCVATVTNQAGFAAAGGATTFLYPMWLAK